MAIHDHQSTDPRVRRAAAIIGRLGGSKNTLKQQTARSKGVSWDVVRRLWYTDLSDTEISRRAGFKTVGNLWTLLYRRRKRGESWPKRRRSKT